jgi:F0F1-type ATP synthase assembly protein I
MSTPADIAEARRASWGATVGTAVGLQWLLVLILTGVTWIWSGEKAGWFLFLGGAAVALPNSVLALWLTLRVHRVGTVGVVAMFVGEFVKLWGTIALLVVVVVKNKPDLAMLPLIIGVIVALKAQWLALWVTRRY